MVVLLTTGCVSTGAGSGESEDENVFAAYSVDQILEGGNSAYDNGEYERAVYIYMQALEVEQSAETWYRIGIGKNRLGDTAFAWRALNKSIELDPDFAKSHQELGLINISLGQPEQAEQHLSKAAELDPSLWRAWNALGVLADIEHRYAEAVLNYQAGLISSPNSALLMNNIGYSYYLAGDLEESTVWFERAVIAIPDYAPAVKNLGLIYARQGWYDDAVKAFSIVVEEPQAYNDAGYLAMRNGDYEKARELIAEAIRLAPSYYEKAYENLELVKQELRNEGNDPSDTVDMSNASEIVSPDGKKIEYQSVVSPALNVRSGPTAESKVVNYLRAGNEVEVIVTLPGWAFVNYRPHKKGSNLTGWVNSDYLSGVPDALQEQQAAVTKAPASKKARKENSATASTVENPVAAANEVVETNAATETHAATSATNANLDVASVIKSIEAVCDMGDLGDQAQKTPHTAGSCIGVASADADE
jgi:Flp pilus assembly protein TadD/SH3-like domain-containing protein